MEALVELRDVSRAYERPDGVVRALDGVSLRIDRGGFLAVMGASGSGKSTLLHVLGLLDTPTSGGYRLGGREVARLGDEERTALRNRRIGFVFQSFHLVPHLSILENVELPLVYRGTPADERCRRARERLDEVGLGARVGHRPDELSGGEQQRAAIARALVGEPDLLLADEPTGNLDATSATDVLRRFVDLRAHGATIVLVTHDPDVAAFADARLELRDGRTVP